MYRTKIENEKAKVKLKQRAEQKKKAREIAEWAERQAAGSRPDGRCLNDCGR